MPDRRRNVTFRRSIGSPELFAIVYTTLSAAIYFSLGVVADHALGLTPVVLAVATLFFVLASMTYAEGASLHKDRAGSTVFARYAFNELVSFVAGWAVLLDFLIVIAVTALTATHYLAAFWGPLDDGAAAVITTLAVIAWCAGWNVFGITAARFRRLAWLAIADLLVQVLVIVLGFALVFDAGLLVDPIDLGGSPSWKDLAFAFTVAAIAFTGLESSSGLAGEVAVGRRGLRRVVAVRSLATLLVYVGIAVVALTALPVQDGRTELGGRWLEAPLIGVVEQFGGGFWGSMIVYLVGAAGAATLIAAAQSAMLGLSRLAYSLATNRQIPSALGRLHPRRGTPYVVILTASVIAAGLAVPGDLDFLVGIYAFGAMLAFTIAHVSVIALRFREPLADRPYRIPFNVRIGSGSLPLPAALGAFASAAALAGVVTLHGGARAVGLAWLGAGVALYVAYRRVQGQGVFKRVTVKPTALQTELSEPDYGSILVPLFGEAIDDDIVQTAGRMAGLYADSFETREGAEIEVIWVIEIPMSLPLDAPIPPARLDEARRALAHAKAVGEEYEGVIVNTATVRARRAGQAIVDEARRRGVEAIVLAAEEPSRIGGGSRLGGRGVLDNYVGEVTKYVVRKAPCRVILTAPARAEPPREERPA